MNAVTDSRNRIGDERAAIPVYSSKIIKAGALLADTKTLLSQWDINVDVPRNLQRIRHENIFGKASRSRVEDILAIFRQRYLSEETVTRALVILVRGHFPAASLDRILYFLSARADKLLYDFVTEVLCPLKASGVVDIHIGEIRRTLLLWTQDRRTKGRWSENTIERIAQGLLSSLRDFGVLKGRVHKQIAPAYLPLRSFCYLAFYLKQHEPSCSRLLDLADWDLFFLSRESVERFLFEAHQNHFLEYHAAGSVTRLTFPAGTLEEYANVLVERTH